MARPTKLTEEVQRRICQAISAGNYYEAAAGFAGISWRTLHRWIERGRVANKGLLKDFYDAICAAEMEAEVRMVAQWQQQIPQDWRAARDFLARRHPKRWGATEKYQHEVSGGDSDKPVRLKFDFGDVPVEVVRAIALGGGDEEPD